MFRRLSLACLLVLAVQSSTASAASGDPKDGRETLRQAFPLDPTGAHLETTPQPESRGRSQAVRALPETADASAGPRGFTLALAAGLACGGLFVSGARVTVRRRNARSRPRSSIPLSQTGWAGTRQRILEYWEPFPPGREPLAIEGHRHPDIAGHAQVRALELAAGDAPSSPPAPSVEWSSVGARDA